MKKVLSALMALILCLQVLPLQAAAETVIPVPTDAELTAAVLLTGLSDDAPGYHEGMAVSANMSAVQLVGWILDFQTSRQAFIMDTFENYDVELAYLKENYPATFSMLQGYTGTGIGKLYDEYSKAKEWQDEVNAARDRIENLASDIYVLAEDIQAEGISEKQRMVFAWEIRDKWQDLKSLTADTVRDARQWEKEFERLNKLLTAPYEYSGSPDSLVWLFEAIDRLQGLDHRGGITGYSVAADQVRIAPDQTVMTRLARLSPITNALADSDQTMMLKIIDDKHFYLGTVDGAQQLQGTSVSVTASDGSTEEKTLKTDSTGYVEYAVREFPSDAKGNSEINIKVSRDGYRRIEAPKVSIRKGGQLTMAMQKDDGAPYPVAFTFWGHDLLLSDYEVITSPFNDTKQKIGLTISSGADFTMKVYFMDKEGKNRTDVGTCTGGKGDTTFSFEDTWLMKMPDEGKLYAEITSGGEKWTYEARLKIIAPKIAKPIGDPKMAMILKPELSFTLPSKWPQPFSSLKISVSLPIPDKYKFTISVDLDGNAMLAFGTTAFDDRLKKINDGMWKTEDQKTINKKISEAEEKGYIAKAKAAQGGDWAGRSKWNPFKLGKFSLDMAFFGFAQIQYREDAYEYGQWLGKGGGGFAASFKGEYTLQWPFVALGFSASATFSFWPELGVAIKTYWPGHTDQPQFKGIDYAMGKINLVFRIDLGVILTAGLKGVAGASIQGFAYLQFAFKRTLDFDINTWLDEISPYVGRADNPERIQDNGLGIKIVAGGGIRVIVEIFWVKITKTLLESGDIPIYDNGKATARGPETLVDRFIAVLTSGALAEDAEEPAEGLTANGGQVETDNVDLMLKTSRIDNYYGDEIRNVQIAEIRPSGYSSVVPVVLFLRESNGHTILSARPDINRGPMAADNIYPSVNRTDLLCQNSRKLPADQQDHYGSEDGYDVIDYDFWVADISKILPSTNTGSPIYQDLISHAEGQTWLLTDVLFTVCILAKDYEEQEEIQEDGTALKVKVPKETFAYVRCYFLNCRKQVNYGTTRYVLDIQPLVLSGEYHRLANGADNYLSMCFPMDSGRTSNPQGRPGIVGTITEDNWGYTQYDFQIQTMPLNLNTENGRERVSRYLRCSPISEDTPAERMHDHLSITDMSSQDTLVTAGKYLRDTVNYPVSVFKTVGSYPLEIYFDRYYLVGQEGSEEALYELVKKNEGNYYSSVSSYATKPCVVANKVVSATAAYGSDPRAKTVFFVRQTEDGEGFSLFGAYFHTQDLYRGYLQKDYDISMPPADLHWTKLYGRECLYWMESNGLTEDGQHNLFTLRGMWYDEKADCFSAPFNIGTLKTESENCFPDKIWLVGGNQGIYVSKQKSGEDRVYDFTFKLVMGTKLVGNVLNDTLANPGSYDDMMVTLYNNGNVPLSGVDLVAYHAQAKAGEGEAFETIHLDFLDADNNSITLNKGLLGATEQRTGIQVAQQEESSFTTSDNQEYRYLEGTTWRNDGVLYTDNWYGMPSGGNPYKKLMKPILMMPGSFTAYNISLNIPQGWEGSHHIYLQVDRLYISESSSFQQNLGSKDDRDAVKALAEESIISIGRDGTIRREGTAARAVTEADYRAYKTDITFDRIELYTEPMDLELDARTWNNNGTPMVTLTLLNRGHVGKNHREANTVVMEAFLDDETNPVFRYSLPEEVSDKEAWTFELPLSLLTDSREAGKVTVKVRGKDYTEYGDHDNSVEILLNTKTLMVVTQPEDQRVPEGSNAAFQTEVSGGRKPYRYQWQVKAPGGKWADIDGAAAAILKLSGVTMAMDGNLYRCVITDDAGASVTTRGAKLTVYKIPGTGDDAPIGGWIAGLLIAIAGLLFLHRRRSARS